LVMVSAPMEIAAPNTAGAEQPAGIAVAVHAATAIAATVSAPPTGCIAPRMATAAVPANIVEALVNSAHAEMDLSAMVSVPMDIAAPRMAGVDYPAGIAVEGHAEMVIVVTVSAQPGSAAPRMVTAELPVNIATTR